MEVDEYVEGLTGEEIINDVVGLIRAKLSADCNLRETDAYLGGYDGKIVIRLNLHGLDTEKIDLEIKIGVATDDPDQKTVDAELDIPVEVKLNAVRERSGQDVPTLSKDDEGRTVVKKRHYARKQALGGATGDVLPD